MSYANGWAALNLQMPPKIPRCEYSADFHWPLVRRVTGLPVDEHSPQAQQLAASQAFRKAWDYSFNWSVLIHNQVFGDLRTRMGHAAYAAGGTDMDRNVSSPFSSPEQVLAFDPMEAYGPVDIPAAVRDFDAHYDRNVSLYPDEVNMTGIYVTLISGLIEIFGWEGLLQGLAEDAGGFGEVANRYTRWIRGYFEALAESKAPCVMVHDDIVWTSGPFVQPAWYRAYVFPNYRYLFEPLIEAGKKIIYTSDGTYTQFIDDIAGCGIHGFVLEPTTDMGLIAQRYGRTHAFIGNVDTRALLSGKREAIRAEVERCMAIGRDCPGFMLAVGNHIPPNTPVDACLYYQELYERLSRR